MGRSKTSPWVFFLFIIVLAIAAYYVDSAWTPYWPFKPANHGISIGSYQNDLKVHLGLDLQGGIQFVLQASCPSSNTKCNASYISDNLPAVVNNLTSRVNGGLGVTDAVIRTQGSNRVSVELPGLQDDQQAQQLLGKTGQMNIFGTTQPVNNGTTLTPAGNGQYTIPNQTGTYPVLFTGQELDPSSINAGLDPTSNQPLVTFTFTGAAKGQFATYTKGHVGGYLTTTLDDKVINSATIQSEIDGNGQITGLASVAEAQNLASLLKYGALPLPLSVISESHLAATLGAQAIEFSLRAALIGLGMVILFMLIYYRLPGLLADVALLLYALVLFATIKILGVTLSLAGIAGLILSVGMAVDANVLIFERIKEELRAGRTMAAAIDIGFKRAWPSIRDSNASTMITCVILYIFGSNFGATIIVGFASNLFIGVALSLFTAVVVTRNFLNLLVPTGIATHPALYGLPASALNVARYNPSRVRAAANAATAASRLRRASAADASEGGPNGASNGSRPAVGAARTTSGRQEVEE
ncbi:MAG TPA: protein translocase subunit SecD [Ktedonobacterales bacterium]|nr:protein translocase subunit SecD [Ktedonobacterales bacterium]